MNLTDYGASGGVGHHVRAVHRAAPRPPAGQSKVLIVPDIFDPAL
jgi:hypothetical protein